MSGFRAKVGRVPWRDAGISAADDICAFLFEKVHAGRKEEGWKDDDGVCVWRRRFWVMVWRCAWGKGEREGEVGR